MHEFFFALAEVVNAEGLRVLAQSMRFAWCVIDAPVVSCCATIIYTITVHIGAIGRKAGFVMAMDPQRSC